MKNFIHTKARWAFAIMAMVFSSISFAQAPGGPGGGGPQGPPSVPSSKDVVKMVNKLAKKISLSDEQKKSVLAVYQDHYTTVRKKIANNSRPKRDEMEALDYSFEKNVKKLLTKEQQKEYVSYLKKTKQARQGPPVR